MNAPASDRPHQLRMMALQESLRRNFRIVCCRLGQAIHLPLCRHILQYYYQFLFRQF
jgi:hypothetical protein